MDFYNGAIPRHSLNLDTDDLSMLQPFEQLIQNIALGPELAGGIL
jgi:hypothetical protein